MSARIRIIIRPVGDEQMLAIHDDHRVTLMAFAPGHSNQPWSCCTTAWVGQEPVAQVIEGGEFAREITEHALRKLLPWTFRKPVATPQGQHQAVAA